MEIGFLECVKCSVHANRTKTLVLVKATEKQMKSLSVALCSWFNEEMLSSSDEAAHIHSIHTAACSVCKPAAASCIFCHN